MLTVLGWLDGITALGVLIFSCVFGLFIIYKSRKSDIKLLTIAGLMVVFSGLTYLGPVSDFLSILLTGKNIHPVYLYGLLSYMWTGPLVISAFYIMSEHLFPEHKWYIISIFTILATIYEFLLFLDTPNIFIFIPPDKPGQELYDVRINRAHPMFLLTALFLLTSLIMNGFGFLYRSIQSAGIIRKKFLYLSLGFIIYIVFAALDSLMSPGFLLFIVRICQNASPIFYYLGLKEEHVKLKETSSEEETASEKSEITLVKVLSRLKPGEITDDEVVFYREQAICLVCKGKVGGFNIFICKKCRALYCGNCARSLIDLENRCWVCDKPFDKSKPSKSHTIKREDVEISEKSKKKY